MFFFNSHPITHVRVSGICVSVDTGLVNNDAHGKKRVTVQVDDGTGYLVIGSLMWGGEMDDVRKKFEPLMQKSVSVRGTPYLSEWDGKKSVRMDIKSVDGLNFTGELHALDNRMYTLEGLHLHKDSPAAMQPPTMAPQVRHLHYETTLSSFLTNFADVDKVAGKESKSHLATPEKMAKKRITTHSPLRNVSFSIPSPFSFSSCFNHDPGTSDEVERAQRSVNDKEPLISPDIQSLDTNPTQAIAMASLAAKGPVTNALTSAFPNGSEAIIVDVTDDQIATIRSGDTNTDSSSCSGDSSEAEKTDLSENALCSSAAANPTVEKTEQIPKSMISPRKSLGPPISPVSSMRIEVESAQESASRLIANSRSRKQPSEESSKSIVKRQKLTTAPISDPPRVSLPTLEPQGPASSPAMKNFEQPGPGILLNDPPKTAPTPASICTLPSAPPTTPRSIPSMLTFQGLTAVVSGRSTSLPSKNTVCDVEAVRRIAPVASKLSKKKTSRNKHVPLDDFKVAEDAFSPTLGLLLNADSSPSLTNTSSDATSKRSTMVQSPINSDRQVEVVGPNLSIRVTKPHGPLKQIQSGKTHENAVQAQSSSVKGLGYTGKQQQQKPRSAKPVRVGNSIAKPPLVTGSVMSSDNPHQLQRRYSRAPLTTGVQLNEINLNLGPGNNFASSSKRKFSDLSAMVKKGAAEKTLTRQASATSSVEDFVRELNVISFTARDLLGIKTFRSWFNSLIDGQGAEKAILQTLQRSKKIFRTDSKLAMSNLDSKWLFKSGA